MTVNRVGEHALREIDAEGADLEKVSAMHMELLDFGPMAGLGEPFIRKACYKMHMMDGSLRTAIYEVEGDPAGFVAYTDRGISFHRDGIRKHWLYAAFALAHSLLSDPRRIAGLPRALKVVASRRGEAREYTDPLGEIVCIAVKREYLRRDYAPREGVSISEALIEFAGDRLRERGLRSMRALVDAPNKAALMLYHKLGATFESYDQAGEEMVEVWLDL